MHNTELQRQKLQFESMASFMEWKLEEESRTNSFFVQHSAAHIREDAKCWYFYCNRSGLYKGKGKNARALKSQGSCKIGEICAAHMKIRQVHTTGVGTLEYCSTHHNHVPEIAHLPMPESLRLIVASKLQQGISLARILDDVRDSVAGSLGAETLLSKQSIHNIKRLYNIEGIEKHSNDQTSICAWVAEMQQMAFDPVVTFKPQGKCLDGWTGSSEDDFLLGIQTEFQLDMMKAFGNSAICVDATHGTNVYDFLLVTVLVVDDFGEGIPVGWLITNKEDTGSLTHFFHCLYARTGSITPNTFMSDDAQQYWNAWSSVYGANHTKKLLCTRHVDRSWRRGVQRHVTDKSDQVSTYH